MRNTPLSFEGVVYTDGKMLPPPENTQILTLSRGTLSPAGGQPAWERVFAVGSRGQGGARKIERETITRV